MGSFLSSLSVVRMVKSSLFGPLWVVMAVVLLVHSPVAQACTFWDRSCIDPLSQTAIPVSFRPFLLQDLSLYYAYDTDPSGKGSNPMAKASFWLSFNHARVNQSVIDSNRTSEIAMRVGNLTGTPSGTNNGCDGVWGTGCSNDIKRNLRQAIFDLSTSGESYTQPLASVLNQMVGKQPSFPNCPPQLFDVSNIPVNIFAQENVTRTPPFQVWPSGSMDQPFTTWYIENTTAHEQAEQVAVGIFSRAPSYNTQPPADPSEVQIEVACVQAPSGPFSATSTG